MRDLTPRQRQIAEMVARGLTYRQIGDQLGIAERTAKNYARNATDRLDFPDALNPRAVLTLYIQQTRKAS